MAEITQRIWKSGPRKVKRTAWGYRVQLAGKQVRKFRETWTKEAAQNALAAALLEGDPPPGPRERMTFGQAVAKYLAVKESEGKRSIRDDRQHLARLQATFGKDALLEAITASRIADYKIQRMQTTITRDGDPRPIGPATLNRELASLRHLLRLAVEEWQVLTAMPRVKLLKEPEGRLRFLRRMSLRAC